jgi:hypothetical protein
MVLQIRAFKDDRAVYAYGTPEGALVVPPLPLPLQSPEAQRFFEETLRTTLHKESSFRPNSASLLTRFQNFDTLIRLPSLPNVSSSESEDGNSWISTTRMTETEQSSHDDTVASVITEMVKPDYSRRVDLRGSTRVLQPYSPPILLEPESHILSVHNGIPRDDSLGCIRCHRGNLEVHLPYD